MNRLSRWFSAIRKFCDPGPSWMERRIQGLRAENRANPLYQHILNVHDEPLRLLESDRDLRVLHITLHKHDRLVANDHGGRLDHGGARP